jgi:hypothetical protein
MLVEPLMKLDTLMGGGANEQAIMLCARSIIDYFPNLSGRAFAEAMRYGVTQVDWQGKMTFMAVAKFIREHSKFQHGYRLHKDMTRAEAKAVLEQIRVDRGIPPGGLVETQFIPQEVRDAMQR